MIRKNVDELVGDEVLAKPIMTWDYQVIMPQGATIKREYINRLNELGIKEVYVKEDQVKSQELLILKSDIEESVKEKVKDILERHTYHNNQELEELSKTADSIISNILEEDRVVEKVFDIRERSTDIYEHSISICSLSVLTALKLGIPRTTIHDIGIGCLLHDIGLRYFTTDFVTKNVEELSSQELVEYKKHPVYGYTSLKEEDWISNLSKSIILYHHERLDGSGFPLKIREMPIECMIVNVCDAFDELICGIGCEQLKVYEAIEYMKAYRGVKFNAQVVDEFLKFTAVYPAGTRVLTNEGEEAIVMSQNTGFQDRPVIKVVKDKDGKPVNEIKDLVKIHNIFIDKVLD
ncbi:MAG: HD domain-containing protein [Acetatifactor sp.]|nr:HD domain-containing protein [Acetatifactor sp.]